MSDQARAIVVALIGAAFLVLVGWFLYSYDLSREVTTGWSDRAKRNRYLALEQLAEALGAHATTVRRFQQPDGDTLLFLRGRLSLAPADQAALARWVKSGGHLVTLPYDGEVPHRDDTRDPPKRPDPLLTELEVRTAWPGRAEHRDSRFARVLLPDGELIATGYPFPEYTLIDQGRRATWRAVADGLDVALRVPLGKGRVTLVTTAFFAQNRSLNEHDHAALAMAVLDIEAGNDIAIVLSGAHAGLFDWLADNAPLPLLVLALLVVLWVWSRVPRFGPTAALPEPGRRSLTEHIRATGRLLAQAEAWPQLFAACRNAFDKRLAIRIPGVAAMKPEQVVATLAARTGLSSTTIETALNRTPPTTSGALWSRVRAIESVLAKL